MLMDPLVGASLVSAGANLLNGIFGGASTSAANKANLQATRETNQMNYQIAQDANKLSQSQFANNLDWLKKQYYDTDQYKRLSEAMRKAHFNPALALGSVSPIGSVGAPSQSSFHVAQMEAAHYDPVNYMQGIGDSVGSAVNSYFQNSLVNAQTNATKYQARSTELENEFKAKTMIDRIKQLHYQAKSDKAHSSFYANQAKLALATFDADRALAFGNVKLQQSQQEIASKQVQSLQLDIAAKEIENKWLPVLKKDEHRSYLMSLDQAKAQIGLILANRTLTEKQAESEIQKKVGLIIDNGMKSIDYKIKKDTKETFIEQANQQLRNQRLTNQKLGSTSRIGLWEMSPRADSRGYWPF